MGLRRGSLTVLGAAASGALLGTAWLYPGTWTSLLLGWAFALLLAGVMERSGGSYAAAYLAGVVFHPIGFYWLPHTVSEFGGFSCGGSFLVFLLFISLSSFQFLVFAFFYRNLPRQVDEFALRAPVAWVISELLSIRIFPWQLSHTQAALIPFIQIADIAGTLSLSFMVFWIAEGLVNLTFRKKGQKSLVAALCMYFVCILYGTIRVYTFDMMPAREQKVLIVQGNIETKKKGNIKYFKTNLKRYLELSKQAANSSVLVIWPETVVMEGVNDSAGNKSTDPLLSLLPSGTPYLIGAISRSENSVYNSGVAVYRNGTIPAPYHKQVLMPFGEYVPLGSYLPILRRLSGIDRDFTAGRDVKVFKYPGLTQGFAPLHLTPLICYEDLMPSLSRKGAQRGAQLLVNLTNDAWFGNSAAQYQHHIIASLRAVENKRYLIRSTNSGYTAVVDPLGRTVSYLTPFTEGVIKTRVKLLEDKTFYTAWVGETPWWILLVVSLISIGYKIRLGKEKYLKD